MRGLDEEAVDDVLGELELSERRRDRRQREQRALLRERVLAGVDLLQRHESRERGAAVSLEGGLVRALVQALGVFLGRELARHLLEVEQIAGRLHRHLVNLEKLLEAGEARVEHALLDPRQGAERNDVPRLRRHLLDVPQCVAEPRALLFEEPGYRERGRNVLGGHAGDGKPVVERNQEICLTATDITGKT